MIRYHKLFALLNFKGMKKTDLLEVISSPTLAKLSKGEVVKMDVIEKICKFLDCQPGDIMEYIDEEKLKQSALKMDEIQRNSIEQLKEQGFSREQLETLMLNAVKDYMDKAFAGGNPITDMISEGIEQLKNQEITE